MAKLVEEQGRKCIGSAASLENYKMAGSPWLDGDSLQRSMDSAVVLIWGEGSTGSLQQNIHQESVSEDKGSCSQLKVASMVLICPEKGSHFHSLPKKVGQTLGAPPVALAWFICVGERAQKKEGPVQTLHFCLHSLQSCMPAPSGSKLQQG